MFASLSAVGCDGPRRSSCSAAGETSGDAKQSQARQAVGGKVF
jgi:hypothetical protein